jgi:4-amino-4-deoxy-L-arabinose transferase-like glycosyltransferase
MNKFFNDNLLNISFLFFVTVCCLICDLGGYPIFNIDEARYAEAAREMIISPFDWITPHFNWMTRFAKPPLVYWLMAFSYKLFGVSEFSARLVSALSGFLTAILIYLFQCRFTSKQLAMAAALVFLLNFETWFIGRAALTDMLLTLCMTATSMTLFLAVNESEKWLIPASIAASLGALTKGPLAVLLPGLILVLYIVFIQRDKWKLLLSGWAAIGIVTFAAITLPWYLKMNELYPGLQGFVQTFFFHHNFSRFAGGIGHGAPWFFYLIVLLLTMFPWVIYLPSLIKSFWTNWKSLPNNISYSIIWFLAILVFLSLAKAKLFAYILPAIVPLSILFAQAFNSEPEDESYKMNGNALKLIWLLALAALMIYLGGSISSIILILNQKLFNFISYDALFALLKTSWIFMGIIFTLFSIVFFVFFNEIVKGTLKGFLTLSCASLGLFVFANLTLLPAVMNFIESDMVSLTRLVSKSSVPIVVYDVLKPNVVFYARKEIFLLKKDKLQSGSCSQQFNGFNRVYIIAFTHQALELIQNYQAKIVKQGIMHSLLSCENKSLISCIEK